MQVGGRRRCGLGRGVPSPGQLQFMVGKGHCSPVFWWDLYSKGEDVVCVCVCVEGCCNCRGIMCSLSF